MKKVPCIKCDQEIWEYVRNYLVKWGYKVKYVSTYASWKRYPILVINEDGQLGECNNHTEPNEAKYDRELITDVEEFLQRAAELKGYNYKRKDIIYLEDLVGDINGFPIEIVQHMVNEQVLQGNFPDVTVFQKVNYRAKDTGGFDWNLSKDGDTFWHEVITNRNFELYFEKYPINMKQFKKEDLQSGMVVKLRNGEKYLVVGDMLIERNGFMRLCDYNDKLLRNTKSYVKGISEKYDIMVVYDKTNAWDGGFASGLHHGNIIWERAEIQEFTMEEIMQEFANKHGISVEQIRIKK